MFFFYKGGRPEPFRRIHEVAEWKRQRIDWLATFHPGYVSGTLLRDALGLQDGDFGENVEWLWNMAYWGYPKGWVSDVDPRERVWKRISEQVTDTLENTEDEHLSLIIHGDGEEEHVLLPQQNSFVKGLSPEEGDNDCDLEDCDLENRDLEISVSDPPRATIVRRWAMYPDTYFQSSLLPVYNGHKLSRREHVFLGPTPTYFASSRGSIAQQAQSASCSLPAASNLSPFVHILPPPSPSSTQSLQNTVQTDYGGEADMDLSD
ncbi:hypothetical protein SCP_0400110 [Sparassis crispa]|uniref:PSP proline-rich domain-containing protein n=1 Tax=Sparassis crispa TaxID=139825 RepID=A0A401GHH9_9APHY|nr:hypothetical protein SCP_0400110 [Sparassis crispa]GBE81640.1 hypothetical protein SCP_0400110 [Sparassis crispa]